jgi:hypothetical protein
MTLQKLNRILHKVVQSLSKHTSKFLTTAIFNFEVPSFSKAPSKKIVIHIRLVGMSMIVTS